MAVIQSAEITFSNGQILTLKQNKKGVMVRNITVHTRRNYPHKKIKEVAQQLKSSFQDIGVSIEEVTFD